MGICVAVEIMHITITAAAALRILHIYLFFVSQATHVLRKSDKATRCH